VTKAVVKIGSKIDYFAPLMRIAKMGLSAQAKILPYIMCELFGGWRPEHHVRGHFCAERRLTGKEF
jgi:hypothetical protein